MAYNTQSNVKDTDEVTHIVEPPIADYITQHDGEELNAEQLAERLRRDIDNAPADSKTFAIHNFGILYAPHIDNCSEVARLAECESFSASISDAKKIGMNLRKFVQPSVKEGSGEEVRLNDKRYLTALRTKPFMLLAGISGTGKSRIVREFAYRSCPSYLQSDSTTPGNYCMIEVKPNWHDSSELLGYYSNISKKYMFTKFVKFLVKAKLHPNVPFFVCLDEMNLAPVEQYFAEFLSVLETRRHPDNDDKHIKSGVLVDKEYFKGKSDGSWYWTFNPINLSEETTPEEEAQIRQVEKIVDKYKNATDLAENGLTLPDNVFIIGTVNMDDTTHQFSRKVIDRAMTIEMNGGKLSQMFGHSSDLQYTRNDNECWTMDGKMNVKYVSADDVIKAHPAYEQRIKEQLPARIETINTCLEGTPFVVSYRVLNELTIYLGVLLDDAGSPDDAAFNILVDKAVDQILLMKILPRIEGEEEMFRLSNKDKEQISDKTITNKLEWLQSIAPDITYEDTTMMSSKAKIKEMLDRMQSGFTRFWP